MTKPKILFIDCETLPNIIYSYNIFEPMSYKAIIKEKAVITFAYKWLNDKTTTVIKSKKPYTDLDIVKEALEVINEADYIVGHYSDKFDIKFIRSRALVNGLKDTIGPVQTIDTYKLAKKYFNFNANRLDYLGVLFNLGRKIQTDFSLWDRCAKGEKKAIDEMADYNRQDVILLEKIFLYMLPHVDAKINHNLFKDKETHVCPSCGSSKIQKRGTSVNAITKNQRWQCQSCGAWSKTRYAS